MFTDVILLAPAALLAGALMFLAPCTLPLVPGYLAFIAGGEHRVLRNALAFVLGFSCVFIVLGISAGLLGSIIAPWKVLIARVAGLLFVGFGLAMLGAPIPLVSRTRALPLPVFLRVGRVESSFGIGALFALGWSPCIGPILGAILFYASVSATAFAGALLLGIFSLGFALPFLITAAFLERAQDLLPRWGSGARLLSRLGAVILIVLGLLMLTNTMGIVVAWGTGVLDAFGYGRLLEHL